MKSVMKAMLISLVLFTLTSCGEPKKETVTIVATDNGWDSQMLHNEIAKIVVENAYDGYEFTTSTASSTMNWQSIISCAVDLDIESWTENVATYKDDVANGDIVDVGILVPDSAQGLYVPRYVIEGDAERGIAPMAPDLKTVKDLMDYPHLFPDDENPDKGRIYGGLLGWMAGDVIDKKTEAYGLNEMYNQVRLGDEGMLFASLDAAYNLGKPWVGYCYEPTWISGKLDIVLLQDEPYDEAVFDDGLCEFPSQALKIVSSKDFAKKAPDLVPFFQNYQTGSKLIAEGLAYLSDTGASHEDTAFWFLQENDQLLDQWLPKENADKLRAYLNSK